MPDRSVKVNLNSARLEDLRDVEGIGPGRAEAIVRYRQEHGPLATLDDLDRVPHFSGMPKAERERVKQRLEVRPGEPVAVAAGIGAEVFDLNRATPEELTRVPGIGSARVEAIVRHREERGGFRSLDELDELPHFRDMPEGDRKAVKERLTLS